MSTVSPNLTKTLSLTLELLGALEKRDFNEALRLDQKRQLYCHKDCEFNSYDWIKYDLLKKIQEKIIDDMMLYKQQSRQEELLVSKNRNTIRKSYMQ